MENYLGAFCENTQRSQLWLRAPRRQCTLIVMAVSEKYGHGDTFWELERAFFLLLLLKKTRLFHECLGIGSRNQIRAKLNPLS